MPSEASKKRQAQKRERRQAGGRRKQPESALRTEKPAQLGTHVEEEAVSEGACAVPPPLAPVVDKASSHVAALKLSPRSCTGE